MSTMIQLPVWAHHAPNACRAWWDRQNPFLKNALRARLPEPLDVRSKLGEAWFPAAIAGDRDCEGILLPVGPPTPPGRSALDHAGTPRISEASLTAAKTCLAAWAGINTDRVREVGFSIPRVEGVKVDGRSLEAATTIAWLSHLLGRPAACPVVVSGTAEPDGFWGPVEGTAQKSAAIDLELGSGVQRLIATERCDPTPLLEQLFGTGWQADLARALDVNPDTLADRAFQCFQNKDFEAAADAARKALQAKPGPRGQALCHWAIGAHALHTGQCDLAKHELLTARKKLRALDPQRSVVHLHEVELLDAFLGISLLDRNRPEDAHDLLARACASLDETPRRYRDSRWQHIMLQLQGSLARVLVALDRVDEAVRLRMVSLETTNIPHERCRSWMDLAEDYRRLGRTHDQKAALQEARRALPRVRVEDRQQTERFLELFELRAGLRAPSLGPDQPDWGAWPQPAIVMASLLQSDPQALADWLQLHGPGGQGVAKLVYAGAWARLGQRTGDVPEAGRAYAERLLVDLEDSPSLHAALSELGRGVPDPWVRVCPY